jgi:5-methylcytosine-specific restriction protein B
MIRRNGSFSAGDKKERKEMASLRQTPNGRFIVCFRFRGDQYQRSKHHSNNGCARRAISDSMTLKANQMSEIVLPAKKAELGNLLNTFFKSYPDSKDGKKHLTLYEHGRQEGQKHYVELVAASARGEDVTDNVLLYFLPHADTSGNRDKKAWIHVAPAVTKDIKSWFEGAGWTSPEDWPRISKAILSFVQRCVDDPDQLADACAEFAELPYSKGFQSGMLSPILNAIRPVNIC